jgi:hypothetical protein
MSQEELEFRVGEDEKAVDISVDDEGGKAEIMNQEEPPAVETAPAPAQEKELDQYSDNVKKRIDKLTARLRETQRREEAALEYAKSVQAQLEQAKTQVHKSTDDRLMEAKSRIETQAVALKQIIRKAREEGDVDTEMEAQQRLASLAVEQQQVQAAEQHRAAQRQQPQQAQQTYQQPQQAYQQPQQQPKGRIDPRAEQWAEDNPWFGQDTVMTHAAWGIHADLVQNEGLDPNTDEYYDELDIRIRETFPHKFAQSVKNSRAPRSAQAVAPATRSTGVNNARRTVRLTPSQVAIAKKLGVPLEEYAKYVKE